MTTSTIAALIAFAIISIGLALTWSYHRSRGSGDPLLVQACLYLAFCAGLLAISFGLRGISLPSAAKTIVGLTVMAGVVITFVAAAGRYLAWARPRQRAAVEANQARRRFRDEGPDAERLP